MNKMNRACSRHGTEEGHIKVFVVKPEGKRALGTTRHRWENNITRSSGKN
jgi:hypothetical protein